MERLTVFDGEFWVHKNFPPVGEDTLDEFIDCVKELAARLAAYEDTGLEPDDIKRVFNEDAVLNLAGQALGITPDRLRELAQADREGRCVVLPVKPGTPVWSIAFCKIDDDIGPWPFTLSMLDAWGEEWFLTREEAEKALEERKNG